jgi:predicted DNA-binding transcriptional regulator AlpA
MSLGHKPQRLFSELRISDALRFFDQLPDSANVRQPVVEALYGCSGSTIRRRVQDGVIPPPRKLSTRISAWNVGELRTAMLSLQGGQND